MKDQAALRPGFFNNLPSLLKEESKEAGFGDEEKHLSSLSYHAGWLILKEFSEGLLDDLDAGTSMAITQGLSLEEIGKNAVVIDLTKGLIKRILQKVKDAQEAVDKADGSTK